MLRSGDDEGAVVVQEVDLKELHLRRCDDTLEARERQEHHELHPARAARELRHDRCHGLESHLLGLCSNIRRPRS